MLVISRTPLRLSFFGGSTDYPIWYKEHPGAVLATTINKFLYITVRQLPPFFDYKHQISYSEIERVNSVDEIKHPSVREVLKLFKIEWGVDISHSRDLPARTGMGSSSAFTVGLVNAVRTLLGADFTKLHLAATAIHIEQDIIKENVGSQDQVIAAFGGLNRIDFSYQEHAELFPHVIDVRPVLLELDRLEQLQSHLMLVFTGFTRDASEIASEQLKTTPAKSKELTAMYEMVSEAESILRSDCDISEFGKLLHESWMLKKGLTSLISNEHIDSVYEVARRAGAIGGKLCGAGGGGFLLLFVKPGLQEQVKQALKGLLHVPFRFESSGSQIIFKE